MNTSAPPDRLLAVDLTELDAAKMSALRKEAIRLGLPITTLLASLIEDASDRLIASQTPHKQVQATDIISRASAANRGELPQPEGKN